MKPLIDGKAIDRESLEGVMCEQCGSPMEYVEETGEFDYTAWAVCTNDECDNEFEF